MARRVVTWNGKDLPPELRELPAGRYVVAAVEDEAPTVARVVDEDIDSTKVIDSVRDDSRRGSWVGYVQRSRH